MRATVVATSRHPARLQLLLENGADHAIVDNGKLMDTIRERIPHGVDKVLELIGANALHDSLRCVSPGAPCV